MYKLDGDEAREACGIDSEAAAEGKLQEILSWKSFSAASVLKSEHPTPPK